MKLIIQIPCYNEAETLDVTLSFLPRKVHGFDQVEWLVVNDGSTDATLEVARRFGVDHFVSFKTNQGLARGFMAGLDCCIKNGADVIVNLDGDNQYCAEDIPALVAPIVEGRADLVIGARPIDKIKHFSLLKKYLQRVGSWLVRMASKTDVPDAPSGFRAFSRDAAMRINVFNKYTYTIETIIQAGRQNMAIAWVPVRVNDKLRPSRLIKSLRSYLWKSLVTILRIFVVYLPFRFFMLIGMLLFIPGFLLGVRFLFYYYTGDGAGHVQSVILASVLLGMGFQTMLVAFLADLLAANRQMVEDIRFRIKQFENGKSNSKGVKEIG